MKSFDDLNRWLRWRMAFGAISFLLTAAVLLSPWFYKTKVRSIQQELDQTLLKMKSKQKP